MRKCLTRRVEDEKLVTFMRARRTPVPVTVSDEHCALLPIFEIRLLLRFHELHFSSALQSWLEYFEGRGGVSL